MTVSPADWDLVREPVDVLVGIRAASRDHQRNLAARQHPDADTLPAALGRNGAPQLVIINLDPNAPQMLRKVGHLPRQFPHVSFFLMSQTLDAKLLMEAMQMGVPGHTPSEPLKGVPDNIGPVMAIASLTMSDKAAAPGMAIPVSQISIELYTPITGGIFVGGRFAPESLKVPGMKDLTPVK